MADANNFDSEKLTDARDWLNQEDTKYQRLALLTSCVAAFISLSALGVSYRGYDHARQADRAWLGPAIMRLNHKPVAGEELRFFLDYQNTGRQPAQDIFLYEDSYTDDKAKAGYIADRAKQDIARCKTSKPTDDRLTLFPGGGTFEPYLVNKQFATAVASASDAIFVDGCFVYRTIGEVHRTAFCFKYDPQIAREDDKGRPVMDLCTHGHYAD